MPWESRNGAGRYFTRSRRVNGRVVREYLGTGIAAEIAAAESVARAQSAQAHADQLRCYQAEYRAVEDAILALNHILEGMTRATLLVRGYHQHHRGEWRKRNDR